MILAVVFYTAEDTAVPDGKTYNFWAGGHMVYMNCVILANFIILKMQPLHVRMSERLINRYPASRVKRKHLLDQVDCVLIGSSEQFVEVLAARARKLAHKCSIVIILDLVDERCIRFSNQIRDHHHLFLLRLCRQERLSSNQLSQNTTNTPYVDGRSVLAPGKNDLRCTVPSCGDIVS